MKYTVGIIGNGRFGDMLYKAFKRYGKNDFEVSIFSRRIEFENNSKIKIEQSKNSKLLKRSVSRIL